MLKVRGAKRAVAVFLDEGEAFEDAADRFGTSPVSQVLALADREGLPWVVLTRARQVRLYSARVDTGVGRKGRADTYVEVDLALLPEDHAGFVPLLFGADALVKRGTIEEILERSADFAAELGARLRDRIYFEAVPALATAVARHAHGGAPDLSEDELAAAYEETLVVLFRLLFVAYAEDKDLLPYRTNSRYNDHSLKRLARRLAEWKAKGDPSFDDHATDLWDDIRALSHAVEGGNAGWGVPAYDGGLFSDDPEVSRAGAAVATLVLTDAEFGPPLTALLVDVGADGVVGPVDFRSLSVREFGTIYEGLLESRLSVAQTDLAVDAQGNFVPTLQTTGAAARAGEVYFHNRSGARKASGSYFTKPFAVEHLLDRALDAALDDHIGQLAVLLDVGDEAGAAERFFDFRCVDLAMGSGHFLVTAVDRIEARLSAFLSLHSIPRVLAELERLRSSALAALGDLADGAEIETTGLLRRQVARRCIYGVDRNRISVELARLAVWIHTFVPGLPLSFLDHNLVEGDSLTGIGTIDEALAVLEPDVAAGVDTMQANSILSFLGRAQKALQRLALTSEVTTGEVAEARAAHLEARRAVEPARDLFDLLVANRLGGIVVQGDEVDEQSLAAHAGLTDARALTGRLRSLHFPVAFPEVFLRDRPGFDVIVGNPPWEEATVEELGFWALRHPGLKSMSAGEKKTEITRLRYARPDLVEEYDAAVTEAEELRKLLLAGPYPGMGSGDPDLYKAFCWRFWQLARDGAAIGVVLPRSALSAAGSAPWREAVLDGGAFADVTMLLNTGGWVFDDAEHRYTIGLVAIRKGQEHAGLLGLRGPYVSLGAYRAGMDHKPAEFVAAELRSWSEGASFPLLPSERSAEVFVKLRRHPRLDAAGGWRARPTTEFHATNDKHLFVLDEADAQDGMWPVYKGASFNIWEPDTGTYYAWADPTEIREVLQLKRLRQQRTARSAFSEFSRQWALDPATLPCLQPRIAFRDVARATDSRTVIAALVPPEIVMTNKAPYLLWPVGDGRDEAYLLGVLCSVPLDWYARRVVEISLNFHLFNGFPVPRPNRDDPVRRRVEEIAGRLAAVDRRYQSWAKAVGVPVGSVAAAEKDDLVAELDAAVALLYRLDESDLRHVFETFHVGWRYEGRLEAALGHLRRLAKEMR
ncbi:MAG: Eco57I restriction-modification methylase domain-containing protein [Acidimicrobiales bacterium]